MKLESKCVAMEPKVTQKKHTMLKNNTAHWVLLSTGKKCSHISLGKKKKKKDLFTHKENTIKADKGKI